MQSEIEMLKGRVEALEKAAQAPVPDEARLDRIYSILKEATGHAFGMIEGNGLRLGIRKAMNEFYRGPYPDTQALRDQVQALIKERDILEARLYNVKLALGVEEDKLE